MTEEEKATNRAADPNCTNHCGCGVPFTLDCDTCKDFLGDEYCSPDEEPKKSRPGA